MKHFFNFLLINLSIVTFYTNLNAQINVNLTLDESTKSFNADILFCDEKFNCGLTQDEQSKTSEFGQEKVKIKVWRNGQDFYLLIDKNLDNKFTDDEKLLLKNGSSIQVRINRKTETGKILNLPYEIYHEREEKNGIITDNFSIFAHYSLTGLLNYKNCSSKIALTDLNLDGSFNLIDAKKGTNFSIDMNNDGKFWGAEEYKRTSEILEFCGQNFLISALDNSVLKLLPTQLKMAQVGKPVPYFSFTLLNNQTFSADTLKGKYYVLDFWASYCVPCVENLPQIAALEKLYKNKLSVFSINVDEGSRKTLAEKIINDKQLSDFSVIRGMGDNDSFWETFGSVDTTHLTIPLYALIDKNGIVQYIGYGGEDLAELKSNIEKQISSASVPK